MSAAPIKVLVIDDEPPIRKIAADGVEHAGLRRFWKRRTARWRWSCWRNIRR